MTIKQRVFSLLLCGAMLFSIYPAPVFAETATQESGNPARTAEIDSGDFGTDNALHWSLDDTGILIITGTGDMSGYNFPWSTYKDKITKVIIQEGVTSIGYEAFYDCSKLTTAELPASVTSIGIWAFYRCRSLTLSNLPAGLISIENSAFYDCSSLALKNLPANLTSIEDNAFYGCSSLALTELPAKLTTIGGKAFCRCDSLVQINLPASLTSIGASAFLWCSNLTDVTFTGNQPPTLGIGVFDLCNNLTAIYVPEKAVESYQSKENFPADKVVPNKEYKIIVQATDGGTTSASTKTSKARKQITVTVTPDNSHHFNEWEVISGSVQIKDNSFSMPAEDVEVKAVFAPHEPEPDDGNCLTPVTCKTCKVMITAAKDAHDFTIQDASEIYLKSQANCTEAAIYYKSCSVCGTSSKGLEETAVFSPGVINPNHHAGRTEVQNKKEATTTSDGYTGDTYCLECGKLIAAGTIIPKKSSGNSGGSSGSGGSWGGGSSIIQPTESKPNLPVIGKPDPILPDTSGNAILDPALIQEAIDKAMADANRNGSKNKKIAITVPITNTADAKKLTITIPAEVLDSLIAAKAERLNITTKGLPCFGFSLDTLNLLDRQPNGNDILLQITETTVTSIQARAAISNRPAYHISFWVVNEKEGTETALTDWEGNTVTVKLPYVLPKGKSSGNFYAVCIKDSRKVNWLIKSSYDTDQKAVVFETDQFHAYNLGYGIGYRHPIPVFTDIADHWAADDILFATSRKLLLSIDGRRFGPDIGITRGMFMTALGRLAEIDPNEYQGSSFTDVKSFVYYAPYANWAVEQGIMTGTGKDTFSPTAGITREELAVILANYARKMNYTLPVLQEAITFTDSAQISPQAKADVKALQ